MLDSPIVIRADDPRRLELDQSGWWVMHRSWGAELDGWAIDQLRLRSMVEELPADLTIRELEAEDAGAACVLDAATLRDYPGGPATRHEPLTTESARVDSATRRAFGVFSADRLLIATTYIDVDPQTETAETDFTVVHPHRRGQGLGRAVKALSVLTLLKDGVTRFRSGGSSENTAMLALNRSLGYVVDEEWLTLAPPGR
ncbi:acetyltransferase [Rathayibacter sp. YIM 133350]|uniref:GNAT family N-acetyltransferase n=1 Tax=Rathayibacter sp. YIM 133350 TaxID=3131992 RepID=UPI00307D297B